VGRGGGEVQSIGYQGRRIVWKYTEERNGRVLSEEENVKEDGEKISNRIRGMSTYWGG